MTPKENTLRAITRQGPAWVPYANEAIYTLRSLPLIERPDEAGPDAFGCLWEGRPGSAIGTYPAERKYVITDITRWREQLVLPDVAALDLSVMTAEAESIDRSRWVVQAFCEMGLFERSYLLLGMENALVAYHTHPEEMEALCGALADYKIELIQAIDKASQPDMLWYGDDWGTQQALFMAPEVWRRILRPPTQRIYACAHDLGLLVQQHSCGRIEAVLGDLCDMGADLWQPCQPCNDLARLKTEYGNRISFYGGIDSQFVLDNPAATVEDVRAEVARRIRDMADMRGGYIAAPSHSVPYDPAKSAAMVAAIRENGGAPRGL